MSLAILQEKPQRLPESCFDELYDFMDFLEFRARKKTRPDAAISEMERDEYEMFPYFEEFKAAMEDD